MHNNMHKLVSQSASKLNTCCQYNPSINQSTRNNSTTTTRWPEWKGQHLKKTAIINLLSGIIATKRKHN